MEQVRTAPGIGALGGRTVTALWIRWLEERACDMWWRSLVGMRAIACARGGQMCCNSGLETAYHKRETTCARATFSFHGWNSKELTTQRAVQRSTSDMAVLLCNAAEPGFSYRARPRRATPSVRACPVSTDVKERGCAGPGFKHFSSKHFSFQGSKRGWCCTRRQRPRQCRRIRCGTFKWRRSASPERVAGPRRFRQPRRRGCLRLLLHLPAAVGGGRGHGPGGAAPGLRGPPRLGREPLPRRRVGA